MRHVQLHVLIYDIVSYSKWWQFLLTTMNARERARESSEKANNEEEREIYNMHCTIYETVQGGIIIDKRFFLLAIVFQAKRNQARPNQTKWIAYLHKRDSMNNKNIQ